MISITRRYPCVQNCDFLPTEGADKVMFSANLRHPSRILLAKTCLCAATLLFISWLPLSQMQITFGMLVFVTKRGCESASLGKGKRKHTRILEDSVGVVQLQIKLPLYLALALHRISLESVQVENLPKQGHY